ncbi:hypothetical protein INTERNEXUS_278 [Bacillus phage vB_BspM_Internexus]|nr:hypothetical protein INTERNEXUS_278 [Bacillus phage vB_BspM_Internexus]
MGNQQLSNINGRNFLLEYDGHYHKTGWKGNPKSKEIVEKHDMTKNIFCLKNNIFLYRIQSDKETNEQKILNELNLMFGSSTTIENLKKDE